MTRPDPPGPLPPPDERATVPAVAELYAIPPNTLYDMLRDGTLPSWPVGARRVVTSWEAVRKFFGGRPTSSASPSPPGPRA